MQENAVVLSIGRAVLLFAAAGLAVYSSLSSYDVSSSLRSQSRDQYRINVTVRRLAPVLARLPRGVPVGFITDVPLASDSGTLAFLAAQYALAPHLLVRLDQNVNPVWAVGNFSKPGDYAAAGTLLGFTPVEDFGSGVVVYRRSRQ